MGPKGKRIVLGGYAWGTRLAGLTVLAAMVLFLAATGLEGNKDAASYVPQLPGLIAAQKTAQAPVVSFISARVPHVFGGVDYAPWLFFLGLLALWVVTLVQSSRIKYFRWLVDEGEKRVAREKAIVAERAERLAAHKAAVERMEQEAKERADREAEARARRSAELETDRHQVEALKLRETARLAEEARLAAEAALREAEEERAAAEA
ncbi:MAG: hypothetical protein KGL53_05370, partial [Elusimicrobia bacterium]|nr:hypothetical protein [Elusimicrobiota bacterium]